MFKIGEIVEKADYTRAAIWCNGNGAHIEKQDGQYVIVSNAPAPEKTAEEKVTALENKYGLPRAVRTGLLALREGGVVLNAELMARVDEVEALAAPLRMLEGESL